VNHPVTVRAEEMKIAEARLHAGAYTKSLKV